MGENVIIANQVIKMITTYEGQMETYNLCMWHPEKNMTSSIQDYSKELENVFRTIFKIALKKLQSYK